MKAACLLFLGVLFIGFLFYVLHSLLFLLDCKFFPSLILRTFFYIFRVVLLMAMVALRMACFVDLQFPLQHYSRYGSLISVAFL